MMLSVTYVVADSNPTAGDRLLLAVLRLVANLLDAIIWTDAAIDFLAEAGGRFYFRLAFLERLVVVLLIPIAAERS